MLLLSIHRKIIPDKSYEPRLNIPIWIKRKVCLWTLSTYTVHDANRYIYSYSSGLGHGDEFKDDSLDVYQYFNSSCYSGFDDSEEVRYWK